MPDMESASSKSNVFKIYFCRGQPLLRKSVRKQIIYRFWFNQFQMTTDHDGIMPCWFRIQCVLLQPQTYDWFYFLNGVLDPVLTYLAPNPTPDNIFRKPYPDPEFSEVTGCAADPPRDKFSKLCSKSLGLNWISESGSYGIFSFNGIPRTWGNSPSAGTIGL